MGYADFRVPSTFAQRHLYYSDGIGIENKGDFRIERQSFRNNLLLYVVKGTFYVKQKGYHQLKAGDAMVMRLNEAHSYYSSHQDVATILWMHFGHREEDVLLKYIEEEVGLPYITGHSAIKASLVRCLQVSKGNGQEREYVYSEAIYQALVKVCAHINNDRIIRDLSPESLFKQEAEAYVHRHMQDKPSLDDFAASCGFSKYHFTKLFNKYYGCSPIYYIYKMKIDYSKSQLSYTSDSIGLIASNLGFDHQSHYARLFKSHVGITPSAHRKSR